MTPQGAMVEANKKNLPRPVKVAWLILSALWLGFAGYLFFPSASVVAGVLPAYLHAAWLWLVFVISLPILVGAVLPRRIQ
ncbi:MAG: hypothetical protein ABFS30_08835 [Pseudomonadota bacterium]